MADRLQITELDFDTIKRNLKNFLRQQSEFTYYDFEKTLSLYSNCKH
jgi:hypothetical protein